MPLIRSTVACLLALGCALGCEQASRGEAQDGPHGAAKTPTAHASGAAQAPSATGHPNKTATPPRAPFAGLATHLDLGSLPNLAEVRHDGWNIDFGTPEQTRFVVGKWNNGIGKDRRDGTTTFVYAGSRAQIYFTADQAGPLVVQLRARPVGSRAITPYLNDTRLPVIRLAESDDYQTVQIPLPAEQVHAGENYLLLSFGGVKPVDGEEASMALDWARIQPAGARTGAAFTPFESLVRTLPASGAEPTRPAWVVPRPTTVRYYVQVPRDATLGFTLSVEGAPSARLRVVARQDGRPAKTLFDGTAGAEPAPHAIDLAAYAGQIVRLDLEADAGPGEVVIAAPRVLVPRRPPAKIAQAKNVIILLIDTLRADRLKAYDPDTKVKTPALDALADESVLFEHAEAPENWTKPSCASILTGLYPMTHRQKTESSKLPDSVEMISEHLKGQGFATSGFVANGFISNKFGFEQGWDYFRNYIREQRNTDAENVLGDAAKWIVDHKDQRFFTYIQLIDPHVPYDPPDAYLKMYDPGPYDGQVKPRSTAALLEKAKHTPPRVTLTARDRERIVALYDGEVSYLDHYVGRFVDTLKKAGVWDDTLLVVTADHGEELNDHGKWGHGHSIYQELLHVPLFFRLPGATPGGARVSESVDTVDIASTINALLGVPRMKADEGVSLVGFMTGDPPEAPYVAFSDFQDVRRVATAAGFKFVLRSSLTSTFFDLRRDPGEKTELGPSAHPVARRYLRGLLSQFLAATDRRRWIEPQQRAGVAVTKEDAKMDETTRDQLRALGYAN